VSPALRIQRMVFFDERVYTSIDFLSNFLLQPNVQ